jgi:hypothetical protein
VKRKAKSKFMALPRVQEEQAKRVALMSPPERRAGAILSRSDHRGMLVRSARKHPRAMRPQIFKHLFSFYPELQTRENLAALLIDGFPGITNDELAETLQCDERTIKRLRGKLIAMGYRNAGQGKGGWLPPP